MRFVLLDSSAGPVPSPPKAKTPYVQYYEKCSIILLQIPSHTSRAWCMLLLSYILFFIATILYATFYIYTVLCFTFYYILIIIYIICYILF